MCLRESTAFSFARAPRARTATAPAALGLGLWQEEWEKHALYHPPGASEELMDGFKSYAFEQAAAEDDFAQRLETQWHGSRVLAYAFLSSVGVSKADLVNVFDLPVPPPIPPKAPQFVHLDNLISMEDHEDT